MDVKKNKGIIDNKTFKKKYVQEYIRLGIKESDNSNRFNNFIKEVEEPNVRRELNVFLWIMIFVVLLGIGFLIVDVENISFEKALVRGDFISVDSMPVFGEMKVDGNNSGIFNVSRSNLVGGGVVLSGKNNIVYNKGYASVDGETWEEINFSGDAYDEWIAEDAVLNLTKEYSFVAVFSCGRGLFSWKCNDDWKIVDLNSLDVNPWVGAEVQRKTEERRGIIESVLNNNGRGELLEVPVSGSSGGGGGASSGDDSLVISPEQPVESTCVDGVQNGDETGVDCGGGCPPCYIPLTCSLDSDCSGGHYCANSVCLLSVSGNTYFVANWGNDGNSGTFNSPWLTWGKATRTAQAGDIVYFRGGVFFDAANNLGGARDFNSGTLEHPIRFYNYPGEIPILDCSLRQPNEGGFNKGITIWRASNLHLKGLTIRNVHQVEMNVNAVGITMWNVSNITTENVVVHDVDGEAFVVYEYSDTIEYINCDAYNLNDNLRTAVYPNPGSPGQNGAGFHQGLHADWPGADNARLIYRGCRAWNYSDNGFAGTSVGYVEYDSCWAFNGGMLSGEGCGFKYASTYSSNDNNTLPIARVIKNCIGALNGAYGFSPNNRGDIPLSGHYYNNFAYRNGFKDVVGNWGHGFVISNYYMDVPGPNEMYSNNLAYDNELGPIHEGDVYIHEYNSWDLPVVVTADDFVSLDWTQLMAPRKPDGSLPDITFGHLKENSDLIDAGIDVGLPFSGIAPDLGAFEYLGTILVQPTCSDGIKNQDEIFTDCGGSCAPCECLLGETRSCSISNGVGQQSRNCVDGVYAAWSSCVVVSCNIGYHISGNSCVENSLPVSVSGAIIADHSAVLVFEDIPASCIEKAKQDFRISYAHTSHGSQIISGMNMFDTQGNVGDSAVSCSSYSGDPGLYDYCENYAGGSTPEGVLSLWDFYANVNDRMYNNSVNGYAAADIGYLGSTLFADSTRVHLAGLGSNRNVVMWSWCGGAAENTFAGINSYLQAMNQLELDYPNVRFIYMTGHLDGSGEAALRDGVNPNLRMANQIIRDFAIINNKTLFDFEDIESWDPNGVYYVDGGDDCAWCANWCNPLLFDCGSTTPAMWGCGCAHSRCYNCYQKAKGFWWMIARMAGWNGLPVGEGGNNCL